jgi:membrane-associated protein
MSARVAGARRARAADFLCVAALIACQAWAALSVVFVPTWIGTRPVALEAVNGSILSVAAAGAFVRVGRAGVAAALLAPLPLWLPLDVISWWAGRRFGRRAAAWLIRRRPSSDAVVARCERFLDHHRIGAVALAPWLPVPAALLYAATGWRRMRLSLFIAVDAAGTLARNGLVLVIGYSAGAHAVTLTRRLSEYAASVTGALVVGLLGILAFRALQIRRREGRVKASSHHTPGDD